MRKLGADERLLISGVFLPLSCLHNFYFLHLKVISTHPHSKCQEKNVEILQILWIILKYLFIIKIRLSTGPSIALSVNYLLLGWCLHICPIVQKTQKSDGDYQKKFGFFPQSTCLRPIYALSRWYSSSYAGKVNGTKKNKNFPKKSLQNHYVRL